MKILGVLFGFIILVLFLFFQFRKREPDKEVKKEVHELIGLKMKLNSIRPLREKFCTSDSTNFKIVVFGSADCSQCEHLIKILNDVKEGDIIRENLVVVLPSFQESIAIEKYSNIEFPIFFIEPNEVTGKIKTVPTFLFLDDKKVIINVVQGGIIVKDDLDFMMKEFSIKHKTI